MGRTTSIGAALARELDLANTLFHDAYADARHASAAHTTIFIVLADDLIAFCHGARRSIRFTPELFHAIKSAAHVVVALYTMMRREAEPLVEGAVHGRLVRLRAHLVASLALMGHDLADVAPEIVGDLRTALTACVEEIDRASAEGLADPSPVERFARNAKGVLLRLTEHATRLQIDALHHAVEQALSTLTAAERKALHVVVAGDHQARDRNLALQYFERRMREAEGTEHRVMYGENVTTEDEALQLVGVQRVDRAIAKAYFGDAKRLQRDVLGDAARARLDALDLPPIE